MIDVQITQLKHWNFFRSLNLVALKKVGNIVLWNQNHIFLDCKKNSGRFLAEVVVKLRATSYLNDISRKNILITYFVISRKNP